MVVNNTENAVLGLGIVREQIFGSDMREYAGIHPTKRPG
jgi:hypothetical protein